MSLWVDKYCPESLRKLDLHQEINDRLVALAGSEEIPHMMFFGPPGAGKKTRVSCLLREIFGPGVDKIKIEHKTIKTPSNKTVEISTLGSNYHIQCNPSDAGSNDRFVIQDVIKEIASHANLNATSAASRSFKVVVLTEVDRLSRQAQAGLRRTMEKYSSQCRIILICNSPSKVIEPVRSRCLAIRIPAPSNEHIANILVKTAKNEATTCTQELAMRISLHCDRNLRRGLLMLEASKVQSGSSTMIASNAPLPLPDWEVYITRLAREILSEQTPAKLLQARDMLYELLTNCIPADVIIQNLTKELMKSLDDTLKHELIYWAAEYEHRIRLGSKDIFHLEAFVAKFMALYKRFLVAMFG